jgi:hypothetical protein
MLCIRAMKVALVSVVALIPPLVMAPSAAADLPEFCFGNVLTSEAACTADPDAIDEVKASIGIGSNFAEDATVLVARLWSDAGFSGSSFDIYYSAACNTGAGLDWQFNGLSTFNDVTTSFQGFASCKVKIWENSGYSGSSLGPLSSSSNVGATINDQTSSVEGY